MGFVWIYWCAQWLKINRLRWSSSYNSWLTWIWYGPNLFFVKTHWTYLHYEKVTWNIMPNKMPYSSSCKFVTYILKLIELSKLKLTYDWYFNVRCRNLIFSFFSKYTEYRALIVESLFNIQLWIVITHLSVFKMGFLTLVVIMWMFFPKFILYKLLTCRIQKK